MKKALFFAALLAAADSRGQGTVSFERDVLPIFEAACIDCHGAEIQESGLRLDTEAAVVAGGILGPSSGESALIRRLLGLDEPAMPFGAEPLSATEIALIKRWIEEKPEGRSAPAHWAYRKPVRPEPPKVSNPDWVRNPIDAFVLARLDREGLSPSREAPKETLLRRLSLDLIGLPPTLEELDRFLEDGSPGAYERAVDRLLASPHYGERWARPWLDLARFADTNGYEKDGPRSIWKYRDWVIDALNRDLSFQDFTIEQIAGDMLEDASVEQRIATGFHRNTLLNQEGGVDDEEARFETLLDRVNTTATVWLGTTLACAQCHNHKFDPFTQKDYYRFLAFFDNSAYEILKLGQGESWVVEPELPLPTPEQKKKRTSSKPRWPRCALAWRLPLPSSRPTEPGGKRRCGTRIAPGRSFERRAMSRRVALRSVSSTTDPFSLRGRTPSPIPTSFDSRARRAGSPRCGSRPFPILPFLEAGRDGIRTERSS